MAFIFLENENFLEEDYPIMTEGDEAQLTQEQIPDEGKTYILDDSLNTTLVV